MEAIYTQIVDAVLENAHEDLRDAFLKRITYLYSIALQSAFSAEAADERQTVIGQIIDVEKRLLFISLDYVGNFEKLAASTLVGSYSMVAFELAKMRLERNTPIQLAGFVEDVFLELLSMPEIVSDQTKKQLAQPISESLLDFAYARGATDNTSFRMMHYLRQSNG